MIRLAYGCEYPRMVDFEAIWGLTHVRGGVLLDCMQMVRLLVLGLLGVECI